MPTMISDPPTYEAARTVEEKAVDREVLARVKRGIRLLQRKHGDNWVEKINLRTLKLTSGNCCVLGQLYGDYRDGCTALWGEGTSRGNEPVAHGFLSPNYRQYNPEGWSELQRAWEQELRELTRA